ncbi:GNAT family N-acetyltransferase [Mesonia sp.]|uniref:GNAT family N-acetyltransferase n=1 Tax=Mesonia sp. TaxID=1960830 RepID=UPI001767B159|nr:GNAT family N-acetyltransferase [Mesonia sp.]HIB37935.1 GNAT family N-acetyltransferase [Mesonia sp.]HIO27725.1 GNAT family N-acetyltransferase [Flavobacteriaceae bacterium]
MEFQVRKAIKNDMPSVLKLINELAVYEREPDAVEVTVADLEKDGFGDQPLFNCFVAEAEDKIVGMALFYNRYSTWKGKTIHLEDLIVNEDYRGKGIGMQLYKKVMQFALEENIKRVEWVVLDWNTPAVNFYKNTGASVFSEWDTVQFDQDSIKKFLNL